MRLPVYLDNNATTRVDERVVQAMLPYFTEKYGNAASRQHEYGWSAEGAVEAARARIASLIGASPTEIVFTSGATESINLGIKGIAESLEGKGNHVITAVTEHKAVLDTIDNLERHGFRVTRLPVEDDGRVDPRDVEEAITGQTIIVSIMTANNEIGTIAPIAEIGRICRARGIAFHTDATQAVGKIPIAVQSMFVDLMSFSAHKMYGPKGIGALYVRSSRPALRLVPQMDGGGHERGLRSGTLNVPAIVGFGSAAEIAMREMTADAEHTGRLRDQLVTMLMTELPGITVNGHPSQRLPNNASITFGGVDADRLMMGMKDLALSTGSACSSATPSPSHVLQAIGLNHEEVRGTLRFGVGRFTTGEEVTYAAGRIVETVMKMRVPQNYSKTEKV
ncbi:MAG: iscS [Bacteroidetes bacterium]|nr:iscS [Bacteroidota bacterium]